MCLCGFGTSHLFNLAPGSSQTGYANWVNQRRADPIQPILVRRARRADASAVAKIHIASWRSAYAGLMPQATLDALDVEKRTLFWQEHLEDADATTLVAEQNSEVLGWIRARGPEVLALNVDPGAWSNGVGKRLWAGLMEIATDRPKFLWCLKENARARKFYTRLELELSPETKPFRIGDLELVEVKFEIPGELS